MCPQDRQQISQPAKDGGLNWSTQRADCRHSLRTSVDVCLAPVYSKLLFNNVVNFLQRRIMSISMQSIRMQNIRGFSDAMLKFDREKIVFVGENNAGKSSLLLVMDWFINHLQMSELEETAPSPETIDILLPARETGKQARRIEFRIKITDGRTRNRFKIGLVEDDAILLRVNYRKGRSSLFVKLGQPKKSEEPVSDERAIELVQLLRDKISFTYIPSFRDADSGRFNSTITRVFRKRLDERVHHTKQGGAPSEYRGIKSAFRVLEDTSTGLVQPIFDTLKEFMPKHLFQDAKAVLNVKQSDAVDWLLDHLSFELATGSHDTNRVKKNAVGSGLQSMLDIALHIPEKNELSEKNYLAIDEPEAFLHPSAQRDLVALLDRYANDGIQLLLTTHSPFIIEETSHKDIVICADRKFFPSKSEGDLRDEINTALLTGLHAEMLFSKSVLLVEGEGDRQFFEALRRRIARVDRSGACSRMLVVPVGGNTQFIPTAKLLKSFESFGAAPIKWYIVTDADTSSKMPRMLDDLGYGDGKQERNELLGKMSEALTNEETSEWLSQTQKCNNHFAKRNVPVFFLEGDLEYSALSKVANVSNLIEKFPQNAATKDEFLKNLGSKGIDCKSKNDSFKAPWFRGFMGANIPANEVSDCVLNVLKGWGQAASKDFDIKEFVEKGKVL